MHHFLVSAAWWIIPFFLFTLAISSGPTQTTVELSIDCGSTRVSTAADGKQWTRDNYHPNFTIKGASTRSSINRELMTSVDLVPYNTARISRSQFSYTFHITSGEKLIRLHFYPTLYYGFQNCQDLFTVEAGSFTLLSNFSASITADALVVNYFVKEFYVIVEEYQPLKINFYPSTANSQSQDICAFVNGIEIVSVPKSLSYYHAGNIGVKVVGKKSMVYLDNETALELVHRRNLRLDSVSAGDDFRGVFGLWTSVLSRKVNQVSNITYKIPVDVGFSYLVRLYFSDLGIRSAETGQENFLYFIDHVTVSTYVRDSEDKHGLLYRNYIVIAKGRRNEGKRDILISLQLINVSIHEYGPLEGFEIFKLSNHDNSLASPNPLPPLRDSPSLPIQFQLSAFGLRSISPTVFIAIICLVNIAIHMLRKACEAIFTEKENSTSTKATRLIRCFSLYEIQLATKNFKDAHVVGKGGFGIVYKGLIDNGQETVAVKRLKLNSKQGKREFLKEIETLSELRHTNLVPLIGYCNEQEEMILVYAYMANGNLADHLYKLARKNMNYSSLSWEDRLQICIGAGRGLDFLHTGHGVIHRDVKASNILLDETFVAKVSDFGLVKTEKEILLQSQDMSNPKGTPGYVDPDYVRTCTLTTKSDTYSFGVVLLEVLCGRPAVDPLVEEDQRSLTMWALDNISRGKVDHIVAPSLRWEISSNSLKAFVWIVKKCLHNEPHRRPTIAHVVLNLEFALVQQKDRYLAPYRIASVADLRRTRKSYKENVKFLLPGIAGITDFLPMSVSIYGSTVASNVQNVQSLLKEETDSKVLNDEPVEKKGGENMFHKISRVLNITSLLKEQNRSQMFNVETQYEKKEGAKSMFHKVSRVLNITSRLIKQNKSNVPNAGPPYAKKEGGKSMIHEPREITWKELKESNKNDFGGVSISAPLCYQASNKTYSSGKTSFHEQMLFTSGGGNDLISTPKFRLFWFSELKTATNNFRADMFLGEGGFGKVYKGFLGEKLTNKNGCESIVAVKRLRFDGFQGFKEWQSEVNFLGKLSHPNVVKLVGCCSQDEELLLVYEFMEKGSLEKHLFKKDSAFQSLSWNIRLKILTGAARGLAYLHTLDVPIICRDYKTANMLLDGLYNVKLSDFGLAKLGPDATQSHVSTMIKGTYGYAAPEYVATGHLYIKSDVYSFGVTLLEMLTGLRVIDRTRPTGKINLVEWVKPQLQTKKKIKRYMDSSLEGNYPPNCAFQLLQLAGNCLNYQPTARPSMGEVVELLEKIDANL